MILPNELLQIPTPFDDLARLREKPNQAEGVDPIERKTGKCAIRDIRCDGCAHGINDFAPADGFADDTRPDGIPVNERKRDAMVVESDRSSMCARRPPSLQYRVHPTGSTETKVPAETGLAPSAGFRIRSAMIR